MAGRSAGAGAGTGPVRPRRSRRKPKTYPDVFSLALAQYPGLAEMGVRPDAGHWDGDDSLNGSKVIVLDCEAADLERLMAEWADQGNVRELLHGLHGFELERAAQPPEVHVTIAPPEGAHAVPGHFVVQTGPDRQISYVAAPDQPAGTGPKTVVDLAPRARRRMKHGIPEE